MNKKLQIISKNELVDFPLQGILGVPAKIDTGADSSAVWASNIKEKDGSLLFSLFGPGSALYSGQIIRTEEYKTMPVKNSFGEKEIRYVVKLSVKIGEKRYKSRFTLADRSRNHFPILLGKNFLRKRFLVDVASSYNLTPPEEKSHVRKVLVVSSRVDDEVTGFFKNVNKLVPEAEITTLHYDNLAYTFGKKPKVTNLLDGSDIADMDMIYIKKYEDDAEQALAIAQYATYANVVVRDEELAEGVSMSKLSEMMRLSCFGMPVPKGIAMQTPQLLAHLDMVTETIGFPLVLKDVFSDRGRNNYLIKNAKELTKVLSTAPVDAYFVAQKFVPNEGFLRIVVLGKSAQVTVRRSATPHKDPLKSHLNKPRGGSNAELVPRAQVPSAATSLAIKASEIMHRQIAGVDLVKDTVSNEWYILEVNYNPEMVAGAFVQEKTKAFSKFIKEELDRW